MSNFDVAIRGFPPAVAPSQQDLVALAAAHHSKKHDKPVPRIQVASSFEPAPFGGNIPTGAQLGLYQLGTIGNNTTLSLCSHTTDGTYATAIGNYVDGALLGTITAAGTKGFIYTATPGTGAYQGPITFTLDQPAAFVTAIQNDQAQFGYAGVFIDNVWETLTGPSNSTMLSFLQGIQGLRPNILIAGNLDSRNFSGDNGNNGTNWAAWANTCSPYLDYSMCEYFQQYSNSPNNLRLRGTNFDQWWDGWQTIFTSIHSGGAKAMCVTYKFLNTGPNSVYGRASMLTGNDPKGTDVFVYNLSTGGAATGDPYDTTWTKPNPVPVVDPVAGTATL